MSVGRSLRRARGRASGCCLLSESMERGKASLWHKDARNPFPVPLIPSMCVPLSFPCVERRYQTIPLLKRPNSEWKFVMTHNLMYLRMEIYGL